ncbi:type II toxin-antitoxin system VapB family antitoxin [Caulobacter sp. NIBR1757]|uniref:type II toxin-antitoxin system VapB family antitoxin n=1 Tax=Caulobacter sp. NIBR1757 TaxID=3016000 RepID=UPI0022EFE719|nr:type II toxin-antitoxin system VapB family antitoxin [Caulobacter sp. NIBR1757]WGM40426.1 hypothetical protein AMEJIAPC_03371 [Caulobacter sp. NIBR1757]
MAINIKDPATEGVVRELATATGATITDAIRAAAQAALDAVKAERQADRAERLSAVQALMADVAGMPVADPRPIAVIRKELSGGL